MGGRRYVPALDGLRAVAVLAVIGTHMDVRFAAGGALGVDIFFVLSGFLITCLLVQEESDAGGVAWSRFYARRALRLLPALLAVCAFTLVLAYWTAPQLDASAFAQISAGTAPPGGLVRNTWAEVRAALLYGADFPHLFGVERDVFLGHAWSLAVEEQFYVVWPVAFALVVSRLRHMWRGVAVGAVTVALAAVRIAGVSGPGAVFQLRFDQILLGVTVALLLDVLPLDRWARRLWPLAAVLLAALLTRPVSVESVVDRAVFTIAGVAAAALVVAAWTTGLPELPRRILSLPALVYVGRISYGLYLWHLPIVRRIAMADLDLPAIVIVGFKLVLVFAAAGISFTLIERPALKLKDRLRPTTERASASASVPSKLS